MKKTILPLLALALLVCSTELRADDFPLKVGDIVRVVLVSGTAEQLVITKIKGKWIEGNVGGVLAWFNSDNFTSVTNLVPNRPFDQK